ncbi:uncharacterized protein M421DRAFT_378877 [Didymella exigua CBS 183.55]|uniref:Uncharacterized protein n=1 Tax=Didymella exigua CBS 183.55 TaxID=1150837 RepID=A0A6A5R553_9PLEO|nr:uncharacterized protein M421DRAFT_378877 [Didymella exigua CBS 183.55]KAF1922310.1 hypothetical protein M421DRAFT_378877 [Didymella exigua CBS 183.55]
MARISYSWILGSRSMLAITMSLDLCTLYCSMLSVLCLFMHLPQSQSPCNDCCCSVSLGC